MQRPWEQVELGAFKDSTVKRLLFQRRRRMELGKTGKLDHAGFVGHLSLDAEKSSMLLKGLKQKFNLIRFAFIFFLIFVKIYLFS